MSECELPPIAITFKGGYGYTNVTVRRGDVCVHESFEANEAACLRRALRKLRKAERLRQRMGVCEESA